MTKQELNEVLRGLQSKCHCTAELNFELAAQLRDKMIEVKTAFRV